MKNYKVELLKSVGELSFGMASDEVRAILGPYREYENIEKYDEFDMCHTMYDGEDKLEFICFTFLNDINLLLHDKNITKMNASELMTYISGFSDNLEINDEKTSFVCSELGFAAHFEKTTSKLKTICLTTKDYWIKHK